MFDLVARMVLHLLLYFLKACDAMERNANKEEDSIVRGRFEVSSDTCISSLSEYVDDSVIVDDVFPDSLVHENECAKSERNRSFA